LWSASDLVVYLSAGFSTGRWRVSVAVAALAIVRTTTVPVYIRGLFAYRMFGTVLPAAKSARPLLGTAASTALRPCFAAEASGRASLIDILSDVVIDRQ
jgi:hypothetical protein